MSDARDFYDDLAELYDVVYADWEAAMERHATMILSVVAAERGGGTTGPAAGPVRSVLDVSAGIGTQALPLAARGLDVTARDLSPAAIDRLTREAATRGLRVDAGVADMRALDVDGPFDLVVSLDNSIPHLPDDEAIEAALREARRTLAPEGVFVISVRDYGEIERGPPSVHRYGRRTRGERTFDLRQEWEWIDRDHYRTTMVIEELSEDGPVERVRTTATCYAIGLPRLLALMGRAGFDARIATEVEFYQPVLVGRPES